MKKNLHLILAALFLLVFYIYTFQNIRYTDPWSDEAYTGIQSALGLKDYVVSVAVDSHPFLFPVVSKIWSLGFGNSMLALRSLTYIFGCALVLFLAYEIGKKSKYLSVLTTVFLVANPFFNAYLIEARPYTLYLLGFFLVYYTFKDKDLIKLRKSILFFLLTHFFALIYFGGFFINFWYQNKNTLQIKKAFLPSFLLVLFYLLPLAAGHHLSGGGVAWVPNVSEIPLTDFLGSLFYGVESKIPGGLVMRGFNYVHPVYFSVGILAIFALALLKSKERKVEWLTISLIFGPPLFFAILSLVFGIDYFVLRYFLPSVILLYVVLLDNVYFSFKKVGATTFVALYLVSIFNVAPLATSTELRLIARDFANQPVSVLDASSYMILRYYRGSNNDLYWLYGKTDTRFNEPYKHRTVSELPAGSVLIVNSKYKSVDLSSDSVLAKYGDFVVLRDTSGIST